MPRGDERVAHRPGFLERQVEHQHAVDAGLARRAPTNASTPMPQDRVGVA